MEDWLIHSLGIIATFITVAQFVYIIKKAKRGISYDPPAMATVAFWGTILYILWGFLG